MLPRVDTRHLLGASGFLDNRGLRVPLVVTVFLSAGLRSLGGPTLCALAGPLKLGCGCNPRLLRAELGADIMIRLEGIFKVGPDSEVPHDGIAAARNVTKYRCYFAVNAELLALDV